MTTVPPDLLFKALSDSTRRKLFGLLCAGGEQSVGALTDQGVISQPAVSKHLALLNDAGLVQRRQTGRQTRYSPRREALVPLVEWAAEMNAFWERRFDGLENLLDRMDQ